VQNESKKELVLLAESKQRQHKLRSPIPKIPQNFKQKRQEILKFCNSRQKEKRASESKRLDKKTPAKPAFEKKERSRHQKPRDHQKTRGPQI